jgi:N6-adenosine-specific RNA methylase IME4
MRFHPLANIFPLMEGSDFDQLVASLKESGGPREPIILHEQMILDGRNRARACEAAGIEPRYAPLPAGVDPVAFVIDKNLRRRHLDESQRALVASRLATMRQGERTDLQPSAALPKVAQPQAAALMNVSPRLLRSAKRVQENGVPALVHAVEQGRLSVSEAAVAARLDPVQQKQIAATAEAGQKNATRAIIKRAARDAREAALGAAQSAGNLKLPKRRYGVIVADPEWRFEPWSRRTGMDRAADNHYPTSSTEVIAARDVPSIAGDDCVLFLWAIVPMLAEAFCVLDAWGFARFERDPQTGFLRLDKRNGRYVSSGSWIKYKPGASVGMGHWFRVDHEILLVATRGNVPAPVEGAQARSVFDIPASRVHSEKPELVFKIIEHYFPTLPKIELNRRGPPRTGWDAWGNEAQATEHKAGRRLGAMLGPAQSFATMQSSADLPTSHDHDALDIPNFLRIGHPDCWRTAAERGRTAG